MPDTIFWRWQRGGLSRLHRRHPRYQALTWCGALTTPGSASGVAETYDGSETEALLLEPCEDCTGARRPVEPLMWQPEEERAEARRVWHETRADQHRKREALRAEGAKA